MCRWLLSVPLVLVVSVLSATAFNVDSFNHARYEGDDSSMFGFSVAVHKENLAEGWLIVGAPEAQSVYQPRVHRGGAVYKCPIDRDGSCQEVPFDTKGDNFDPYGQQMDNKTEQWFGATVSASGRMTGPVVACAPRYTWYPRKKSRRDPVGTCYVSNGLFNHFEEYSPCRTFQWGYHRQGSCQAGFSAAINSIGDRLFIGSPGSWYWQGQMYSVDAHATFDFKPPLFSGTYGSAGQVHQQGLESRPAVFSTTEGTEQDDDSYMGYSTIVGDFLGNGEEGIAVGMPRGNSLKGKVLIFSWNLTNFYHHFSSDQIGSYYGYALAACDVDGDKKLDLIVGAPMYTEPNNEGKYDVGRVYVIYHESHKGKYVATYVINGFNSRSRFGQALASLGDINQDGYGDFAVGAPYDGPDGRGAVYIYHGSSKGVRKKYSQVIYAEDIISGPAGALATFGFSVTGNLDLDGNEYPDMAVGAYLSSKAFVFRSRPVVAVQADVRFLTAKKEVDIKMSDYQLRSGVRATRTEIEFCVKYNGKGIPQFIDLDLQYILDSKKPKSPRMGFVENQNVNILNDTVRIYKDRDSECRRKQVYVRSDIRDKLTPLEAEMKYWMQEDSRASLSRRVRNPAAVLQPILDLNSPPSRKDSISVHKECGDDNICIPNLKLEATSKVDQYLLDSQKPLVFKIVVTNVGEDAFESTLEVKYPKNIHYQKVESNAVENPFEANYPKNVPYQKVESNVLCNTYDNNTLKCEIGNPIPRGKAVNFQIFWEPALDDDMPPTYDFLLSVNSTNQEEEFTRWDNFRNVSVQLWSQARMEIRGKSYPAEVYFNSSLYTAEIKDQTQYTAFDDRLSENVIGPQVTHVYYLQNNGPVTIKEAEVYFIWPEKTLGGDDLLYLLEGPQFSPSKNVECDPIGANYRGFNLDYSKSIWDKLRLETSDTDGFGAGGRVNATVGGGAGTSDKALDEKVGSSADASGVHGERHQNTTRTPTTGDGAHVQWETETNIFTNSSGSYLVSSSGTLIRKLGEVGAYPYRCYDVIDGELEEISCQSGATYRYYRQTGGAPRDLKLVRACYREANGERHPLECQADIRSGTALYKYYQQGTITKSTQSFFAQKCWEVRNGDKHEVPCGGDTGTGFQVGNVTYKCYDQVDGRLNEIECQSGSTYRYYQQSRSGLNLIADCYEDNYGSRRRIECGPEIQRGHITYTFSQQDFGGQKVIHRCYDTMNGVRMEVDCGSGIDQIRGGNTSTYRCYEQFNGQLREIPCQSGTYEYFQQSQNGLNLIAGCFTDKYGRRKQKLECGPEFVRGQITYSLREQSVGISTQSGDVAYKCYEQVGGQLREIQCRSGSYQYFQQSQNGLKLVAGCYDGSRKPVECGSEFQRGHITYTIHQQGGGTTQGGGYTSYRCFNYINGQHQEIPCRTGVYQYFQAGAAGALNLIQDCYNEANGQRQSLDCGRFFEKGHVSYTQTTTSHHVGNVNVVHRCYDVINGVRTEVACGDDFYRNATYRHNGTTGISTYHRCYDIINGVRSEVPCVPGGSIQEHLQAGNGTIQVGGETLTYRCYEKVGGQSVQVDCEEATRQGKEVTYTCYKKVKDGIRPVSCGPGGLIPGSIRHHQESSNSQGGYQQHSDVSYEQTGGARYSQQGGDRYSQQSGGSYQQGGSQYSQQQSGGSHQREGSQYSQQQSGGSHQQGGSQYTQQSQGSYPQGGSGYSQQGGQHSQQTGSYQQGGSRYSVQGGAYDGAQAGYEEEEDSYYDEDEEEEERGGKAISGYQDSAGNYVATGSVSNTGIRQGPQGPQSRRDPKTYGKYEQTRRTGGLTGLEGAALGSNYSVTTVDLTNAGSAGGGGAEVFAQGGHYGGGYGDRGGGKRVYNEERSWEITQELPVHNTVDERDNVPTDRPTKKNHYYGRKKRSVDRVVEKVPCRAAQCKYMICRIRDLKKDKEVAIAIRSRINARVLRNVTTLQPITVSSTMTAKIGKLPYISDLPQQELLEPYDVNTTIPVTISEIKPDVVPLWVVVLSAVAGTIILLLLVFLLYKCGFFKRNRPSHAPERQPLNRNGYHGDEAL